MKKDLIMADEKITSELVNEIACNKIILQPNPKNTTFNIRNYEPNSKNWYEKGWEYPDPLLVVLYENGRIFYKGQLYHMNEKTRDLVQKVLKKQERSAKIKDIITTMKFTIILSGGLIGIVVIINGINNAIHSKENDQKKVCDYKGKTNISEQNTLIFQNYRDSLNRSR